MNQISFLDNRPFYPYQKRELDTFEDVEKTQKEVNPIYWQLLKRARYCCHRWGWVTADLLRENSRDIQVKDKRIYGSVLRNKCFEAGDYITSKVKSSHSRPIKRWKLKKDKNYDPR